MKDTPTFNGDLLDQHSFSEAMSSASRLFSASDTKWPDFLLAIAQQQLVDDLLRLCLHLRRVSEASSRRINRRIENLPLGVNRSFAGHENDLWTAINRVVHHHSLEPIMFTQSDFYQSNDEVMAGHLIADVKVISDRGASLINLAGLAIASINELGEQSVSPTRVFH